MNKKYLFIILVLVIIILIGGFKILDLSRNSKEPKLVAEEKKTVEDKKEVADFSQLNKDDLLHKLFPNLSFRDGVANLPAGNSDTAEYPGVTLSLRNSIENYFVDTKEKSLLLVAQADGVPHAVGLYHAYLGLFNKSGNLLTPSSVFPKPNVNESKGEKYYDFFQDPAQFGGDNGEFKLYDCKGISYILFLASACANGGCCDAQAELFRVNNGKFQSMQVINRDSLIPTGTKDTTNYALRIKLEANKVIIKKVPDVASFFSETAECPETTYRELQWDSTSCRFK